MSKKCEVWTLFGKEGEPEVHLDVHDTHVTQGGFFIVVHMNGDQVGYYMPNVRRYRLSTPVTPQHE